jgi:hypothetical protein
LDNGLTPLGLWLSLVAPKYKSISGPKGLSGTLHFLFFFNIPHNSLSSFVRSSSMSENFTGMEKKDIINCFQELTKARLHPDA